ncbi:MULTISPECIES: hypothetical protein [unclassified Azospirillum]|nr:MULTISPECIES: hypothetical protein [unclassified Azospirillum]
MHIAFRSFTVEVHAQSLYVRLPWVGEVFAYRGHGVTFNGWKEAQRGMV